MYPSNGATAWSPAAAEALRRFVSEQGTPEATNEWVERICASVLTDSPEIAGDRVVVGALQESVRAHWLAFLPSLSAPETSFQLVGPAADFAVRLARHGNHLSLLFRLYRVAQHAVWTDLAALIPTMASHEVDTTEFLVFVWSRASRWLDASVEQSVELFQHERERVRQGRAAQRLSAVRAILDGAEDDARVLSVTLGGHALSEYQTAMLVRTENADRISDLSEAAGMLAKHLGIRNPLIVSPGGQELWLWAASRNKPDLANLHDCRPWLDSRGIEVAVGTPTQGLSGFRLSHLEAQRALAITMRSRAHRCITTYAEVEMLCLLVDSGDAAGRFVVRALGGLAEDTETAERFRETLRTFLATGSVDLAAKALSVHKNTVRYRIAQAEALIGRPTRGAATELDLALRYYDALLLPNKS